MHDELISASARVEAVRRSEWGALGAWWFRFTLRRALRDVDASARWDGRSLGGLIRAVQQHERALAHGRAVIRWLEGAVAPAPEEPIVSSASTTTATHGGTPRRLRDVLAVIGAGVRAAWPVARPALVILVLLVVSFFARDADDAPELEWSESATDANAALETPAQRRAADVEVGIATLVTVGLLAAGGAALAWWLG